MRTRTVLAPLAALALALAACGSDPEPPRPSGWIDVPGMICADGTQTGIGISRGSADAVLVYLAGGGACWSELECNATYHFGKLEFDVGSLYVAPGTILDRTLPGNPFATWTIAFVPYCTGDVHVGDVVQTYGATTWRHHGQRNLEAAVARLASEIDPPSRVVVAGSSAGGFGALLAYDLVRAQWPAGAGIAGALVDDSGPTFVGTAMPEAIRSAWWDAWNLGSTLGARCPGCRDDLAAIWPALRADHAPDRLALVSTTQDRTMRSFFGDPYGDFSGPRFEAALAELAAKLDADQTAATFRVGGAIREEHALLMSPLLAETSTGKPLLEWLSDMVGGGAWASAGP